MGTTGEEQVACWSEVLFSRYSRISSIICRFCCFASLLVIEGKSRAGGEGLTLHTVIIIVSHGLLVFIGHEFFVNFLIDIWWLFSEKLHISKAYSGYRNFFLNFYLEGSQRAWVYLRQSIGVFVLWPVCPYEATRQCCCCCPLAFSHRWHTLSTPHLAQPLRSELVEVAALYKAYGDMVNAEEHTWERNQHVGMTLGFTSKEISISRTQVVLV